VATLKVVRVIAQTGKDVRISCPVEGNPAPYIEWIKQGEIIDYSWVKYKTHKKHLKIKGVTRDDEGILFCKAVNGFGSTEVKVELYVTNSSNSQEVAPVFCDETRNLNTLYKKQEGDSFDLRCTALGVPPPTISWLYNSRTVSSSGHLDIPRLTEHHSGAYTCLASSPAGKTSLQFYLTVETPHVELPDIKFVSNKTTYQGEAVTLECQIKSKLKPEIQWLQERAGSEYSITLGEMKLINAGDGKVSSFSENMYTSILTIHNPLGSQVYVCLATNPVGGFTYKKAYLTVVVGGDIYMEMLPVLVMFLVVLVIILVLTVSCLMRSRQKLLLSHYQTSSYSTHIYDVPHYSPVSFSDTVSTPLSTRHSRTNTPRHQPYTRGIGVYSEPMEHWEFIKDYPLYTDPKHI